MCFRERSSRLLADRGRPNHAADRGRLNDERPARTSGEEREQDRHGAYCDDREQDAEGVRLVAQRVEAARLAVGHGAQMM